MTCHDSAAAGPKPFPGNTVPAIRAVAWVAALILLVSFTLPARALPSEDRARAFIEGLAVEAIEALTTAKVPLAEKESRFRVLLNANFAVDDIGEWVLGRHWWRATDDQRTEYLNLFEEMLITIYVRRFENYAGEVLTVGRAFTSSGGGDILVDSEIVRPGAGDPVHVGWRVRDYDDGMKIVDVIVEGVSMGQTQRAEFGSIIRRNGGEISALLDMMRQQVENGR